MARKGRKGHGLVIKGKMHGGKKGRKGRGRKRGRKGGRRK